MCEKVIRQHLAKITIDRGKGERIRHTVTLNKGSEGLFTIVDGASGKVILASSSPPGFQGPTWQRLWPLANDTPANTAQRISVQFVLARSYTWKIERLDSTGAVLDTPLDVDLNSKDQTDECSERILVKVKGGAQ